MVLFGLILVPLLFFAGVAVDYSLNMNRKAVIQEAADAAAIAAASPFIKNKERKKVAETMFRAELNQLGIKLKVKPEIDLSVPGQVGIYANVAAPNSLLRTAGLNTTPLTVRSIAAQSTETPEIALVLDVSSSMTKLMEPGKMRIDVLQESAKNFVTIIENNISHTRKGKFAIVPFTMNVNVGATRTSFVKNTKHELFDGTTWAGCVMERRAPYTNTDGFSRGASDGNGKWQAYISPPEPDGGTSGTKCLSRSDGTNAGYQNIDNLSAGDFNPRTKGPNFNCIRHPITPLNKNAQLIRTKIDGLTADGNFGTIIAPGVAWGLRTLSSRAPFKQGGEAKDNVRKIMVVLTDGEQTTGGEHNDGCTESKNSDKAFKYEPTDWGLDGTVLKKTGPRDLFSAYGYIRDSDPFGTNPTSWKDVNYDLYNVSIDACNEAKNSKDSRIEIFTIAVSTDAGPGANIYDLLKNCASDETHFFYAADAAGLNAAFEQIGKDALNVRLIK